MKKAKISVKDLSLECIIGFQDWERDKKQDVLINYEFSYDAEKVLKSDKVDDGVDYKVINKKIIKEVEASKYFMLESLAQKVLDIIMEDKKVLNARVEVDKPGALRFSKSVSVTLEAGQK